MNKLLVILTVTTLASGAGAVHFHAQLRVERARADTLQSRIAQLERAVVAPPAMPFDKLPADVAAAGVVEPTAPAATALRSANSSLTMTSAPEDSSPRRARLINQQLELLRNPEYRQALRMRQRLAMQQNFPDLAQALGISSQQADRLLDLLAEQRLRSMESTQGFDPKAADDMQRKAQEQGRADQAEIADLLGDAGLERWQDYQNTMGSRMRVRQLTNALEGAGIPLRDDQRQALREALAAHERQMQLEGQVSAPPLRPEEMTALEQVKWQEAEVDRREQSFERARAAAAPILSTEQLNVYKLMHEQELTLQRAHLHMRRARLEHPENGPAAGFVTAPNTVYVSGTADGETVVVAE